MKPFNLQEFQKDPSRKIVTRCGFPVRIICTDVKGSAPIVAVIEEKDNTENVFRYESDGIMHGYHDIDLFFAPEKHEGFINLYKNICGGISTDSTVFSTKEHAQASKKYENYLDTIKIEWEE